MWVKTKKGELKRGNLHATTKWQKVPDAEYFEHDNLTWSEEKPESLKKEKEDGTS